MNIKPTPEQVIAWAEQAYNAVTYADVEDKGTHRRVIENKIAELAAQWGAEQEREECAKVCDDLAELNRENPTDSQWQWEECAAAIRNRGAV